ncbi:glycosyltransferase family 2 protein [Primorskyibacter sp. 2E233]|uniref:glycosyltransferase family 2 protein n=1 Tax=Primorskyibacter sp. 2E233 TaxID=3413431 RepID=UPI003BF41D71
MTALDVLPVSVIIPTFNRRKTVGAAIDSVLNQTVSPAEILVVDDGSQDGTKAFLDRRYGARITCIRQDNQGVAAARNTGISQAGQPFVAFLDSDDIWTPNKLEQQYPAMLDRNVVLSASDWAWSDLETHSQFRKIGSSINQPYSVLQHPLEYLARSRGHGIAIQTCICRRDVLSDLGGFDRRFRITEDNDLLFRLAEKGTFALVPDVLMLRCSDGGVAHLTDTRSSQWRAENLDNMLRIVDARMAVSVGESTRNALRRRWGQLAIDRARLHTASGATSAARALYFKQFITFHPTKQTVIAAAGMIAPALVEKLQRSGR